jgi:hypothetical protein
LNASGKITDALIMPSYSLIPDSYAPGAADIMKNFIFTNQSGGGDNPLPSNVGTNYLDLSKQYHTTTLTDNVDIFNYDSN